MSVVDTARSLLGRSYQFGGPMGRTSDDGPCDCSGFVAEVFKRNGVNLPAFTDAIAAQTDVVSDPQPGDLILYRYADSSQAGTAFPHIDIFEGGNQAIGCCVCAGQSGSNEHAILNLPHEYHRVAGLSADGSGSTAGDITLAGLSLPTPLLLVAGLAAALLVLD